MLLDTESFRRIRGWPQNECFHHVDFAVCMVAYNTFKICVPPKEICTYTFTQPDRPPNDRMVALPLETYEMIRAHCYYGKKVCNE
jgi:hypothetical protein